MKQLHNSLVIFSFFKKKLERDLFLMEFSVHSTRKYGKKCKEITHFNEELKQSIFLKQIIDVCAFLDEFKAFRSLAKDNERVRNTCRTVKPALKRIEEVKGLRSYRNALAAHNFREESKKDEIVLLTSYINNQDYPNSIAEMFFLSSLCITIMEAINTEFNDELQRALESYTSSLENNGKNQLRGIKTIREAYDEIDIYRMKLNLQPKFIASEFEEFNIALKKLDWSAIPEEFQLTKNNTSKLWCEVLDLYLRMRGYQDIKYIKGMTGRYTNHWLELYGYAITITNKLNVFEPSETREAHSTITSWKPSTEDNSSQQAQLVYEKLMKVVTS
ncbi:hypothetical protein ACM726_28215 [Pseudomonas aeruginosa]